eukprot:gnl/TRDRNA2_/TRDRNA2_165174_c0_seq1.p1 gnl/TRDRNA2_/TRDRNA2_165174_c0~~gnl/TRDRNA2_/TRDRNA2_165174_c0_seq1.p1  ORF type:complete len:441 (-),score=88.93 gnl/TRDRNA2_/TRDRNA2_165174_c0_seq1:753-2075(-)
MSVEEKMTLEKDEYIRMVNRQTGEERVLTGPQLVVRTITEVAPDGVQKGVFVDKDFAVLTMDKGTGKQTLVDTPGLFFPRPHEYVLEKRPVIRVLPHEAVVFRDDKGKVTIYKGSKDGAISFFLPPFCELVTYYWTQYSLPDDDGKQTITQQPFTRLDMRLRKTFFSYEVRTSDNVKMQLGGTVFWVITDVKKAVESTPDAQGDVWQHCKSGMIQVVSQTTLWGFMADLPAIAAKAEAIQAADGFYTDRGILVKSLEVTSFDCKDPRTRENLQLIIEESTNRINELQRQESENEVQAAKLAAQIKAENGRTQLISTKRSNDKKEASTIGEAEGYRLARSASTFIGGLGAVLPDVTSRVELYTQHQKLEGRNIDTQNMANSEAKMYLTPMQANLQLAAQGLTGSTARRLHIRDDDLIPGITPDGRPIEGIDQRSEEMLHEL